jgi:hypothetical protein
MGTRKNQGGNNMLISQKYLKNDGVSNDGAMSAHAALSPGSFFISERIREITMMCDREHPVYEQIGSFSIALYPIGFFDGAQDLMEIPDLDAQEASALLAEHFEEVSFKDIPPDYHITTSSDHFLLVIGDPMFPEHFALLADNQSPRPFFSKLRFFGSGFDSLTELMEAFPGENTTRLPEIHYFRKIRFGEISPASKAKIYIVRNDGA